MGWREDGIVVEDYMGGLYCEDVFFVIEGVRVRDRELLIKWELIYGDHGVAVGGGEVPADLID